MGRMKQCNSAGSHRVTERTSTLLGWGEVALLLGCATAAGFLFDQHLSLTSQTMIYVLAVAVASYRLSGPQAMACATAAAIAVNFFFTSPRWSVDVANHGHWVTLFALLTIAVLISHLGARLHKEAEVTRRALQLLELASNLAGVARSEDVCVLGQSAFQAAFQAPSLMALRHPDGGLNLPQTLSSSDADAMRCCLQEMTAIGRGTGKWSNLEAWFLPMGSKADVRGVVKIQASHAADSTGLDHAKALAAQLGQALQSLHQTQTMQAAQSEAQRQQVQSTYLAAISHDLRTPLAAVMGAATSLQTQRDKLSLDDQNRLLASIVSETSFLSTLTENTLQLVRLANATQTIQRDWESMEEIVGTVLIRIRHRDRSRRIKSKVPEALPLIKADPVLLAQLITNRLDTALKYSNDSIDLSVHVDDAHLHVAVKDRGSEIPKEKYASIFEPYTRNDLSGKRGAGLGLALCRAIAVAHGASLVLRRRSGGGNSFTFSMPLDPIQPERLTSPLIS